MRGRRAWAALLAVLVVLGAGSGTAGASRELINGGGRAIRSLDRRFTLEDGRGFWIICELLTSGVMQQRGIVKTPGAIAGIIETAQDRNCRNSTGMGMTALLELVSREAPWTMGYTSFSGTLPEITEVELTWEMWFLIQIVPGLACLYVGEVGIATSGITREGRYTVRRFITLPEANTLTLSIPLVQELGKRCPATLEVEGIWGGEEVAVTIDLRRE